MIIVLIIIIINVICHRLQERLKMRKAVGLKWMHANARRYVAKLRADGNPIMHRGREFEASRPWVWRMLVRNGFVSRRRNKIRPTSPAEMRIHLRRRHPWL